MGGTIQAVFTSTWTGPGRVEVCDAPHHLLLTMEPGTDDESQMEAWLTQEGSQTRLVVEERGLPMDTMYLPRSRVAGPPGGSRAVAGRGHPGPRRALDRADSGTRVGRRWDELSPAYAAMEIE